jgi:tetratricopeptide (TPR) repeat protein
MIPAAVLVLLGEAAQTSPAPARGELVRLALEELHQERFDRALEAAAALRRRDPADPAGPLAEANVYQTMMRDYRLRDHEAEFLGALADARRLAEALVDVRPDAEAFFARGTAQGYVAVHDSRCGRWLAALKHGLHCLGDMERAARLEPGLVDPELPLALHDYWRSRKLGFLFGGKRRPALARMERVWHEGRYLRVEAAYSLAAALLVEGRLEDALTVNGWLRDRYPDNPVGLYHRARILEGLERPAEALAAWDAVVARLLASGRISHGFLAECQLHRAQLLNVDAPFAAFPAANAAAALDEARAHARLRDPLVEMEGPFESWSTLAEAVADLERARAPSDGRRRASR